MSSQKLTRSDGVLLTVSVTILRDWPGKFVFYFRTVYTRSSSKRTLYSTRVNLCRYFSQSIGIRQIDQKEGKIETFNKCILFSQNNNPANVCCFLRLCISIQNENNWLEKSKKMPISSEYYTKISLSNRTHANVVLLQSEKCC